MKELCLPTDFTKRGSGERAPVNIQELILKEDSSKEFFRSVAETLGSASQLVLFGAGLGGVSTYDFLKQYGLHEKVVCFIDNNPKKQGNELLGNPVVSLEDFQKQNLTDYLIVISCGAGDKIKRQCENKGIPSQKIIIPNLLSLNPAETDHKFIWDHISEYNALYQLLDDDRSRQTLVNLLNYKISRDMRLLKEICDSDNNQYFDQKLIRFDGSETFVDCGAYIGDTVDLLLSKYQFNKGEILCFETDADNYTVLKQHIYELEKKHRFRGQCHNLAVWSRSDILRFNPSGHSGFIGSAGNQEVHAEPLDEFLKNKKADFIKMDIEGAEINALIGAFHIIQEQKPTLAISVYHRPEHLFQIPMLIKAFAPDYKMYLRHYRECSAIETVCYAISSDHTPQELSV